MHACSFTGFNLLGVGSYDTKVRQGVRCGTMVAVKFLREQQANENDQEYVASLRHEVAVHVSGGFECLELLRRARPMQTHSVHAACAMCIRYGTRQCLWAAVLSCWSLRV